MKTKEINASIEYHMNKFYLRGGPVDCSMLLSHELRSAVRKYGVVEFLYDLTLDNYGDIYAVKYTYTFINGKDTKKFKDFAYHIMSYIEENVGEFTENTSF